nr:hypothetical protein [uncultured Rhodoferax sp.]
MFLANEAHRSPFAKLFRNKFESEFLAVELTLYKTWFLICFSQLDSDAPDALPIQRSMLVDSLELVERMTQTSSNGLLIVNSVQVVTPSHINGTDVWKMEVLDSVITAKDPEDTGQILDVLVTSNGSRYVDSWVETKLDSLQLGEVRFRSPVARPQ